MSMHQESMNSFCACIYAGLIDDVYSTWGAILELLFSIFIIICGVRINYKFLMNLKEEKRNTPLERKGNVIEPIMSWFCWIQIFYWPFYLVYLWINMNGIIPVEWMNGIWCNVATNLILTGRLIVCYNSLFVVLIRYLYIVHHKTVNQWSFAKVGKWFRNLSVLIPVLISLLGLFFTPGTLYTYNPKFEECYFSQNVTKNVNRYKPLYLWTSSILPDPIVHTFYWIHVFFKLIGMVNILEGYMYFSIYQSIKR